MWVRLTKDLVGGKNFIVVMDEAKAVWKREIAGKTTKDFELALNGFIKEYGVCNVACDVPMDCTAIPNEKKKEEEPEGMPKIDITEYDSPNYSDRNATISHIILHNTAGSFNSSISWLCNPQARASAHLIISRKGETACIVPFSKTAWHSGASRSNHNSIGIEIEATNSQRGLTESQEKKLITWIKWMMKKYSIKKENVAIHRWFSSTDCPILIWPTDKSFTDWREKNL